MLGTRTGEMHLALASDPADPAFAPEPLTPGDLAATVEPPHASRPAGRSALLRAKLDSLSERDRDLAGRVLDEAPRISSRMGQIPGEAGAT